MAKISKKIKASMEAVDRTREYVLAEAAALVKQNATGTKFDETIEIAMNLGVTHVTRSNVRGGRLCPLAKYTRGSPKMQKLDMAMVLIWWVLRIWLRPFRMVNQILTASLPG